jgi:transcriptional regulator with XRE-family HTH domain
LESRKFFLKPTRLRADLEAIGARIRKLRGSLFQEELAAYLGISQGQLSKVERGKLAPTPEVLIRLVDKFGRTADWILTGKD